MTWLGLDKRTIVITGGAQGLGRAIADSLAAVNATVVIADFNAEAGEATVADLQAQHQCTARFHRCDVTNKADVDAVINATIEEFGRVDVLVNNAGINIPRLLVDPAGEQELDEAVWDKTMAVNLKGQFLFAQAAARAMLADKKGGVIINMASESGMEGSEGQSPYAATKAAGYNMSRSWAKELGKHGIRVVGVAPGIMEATEMRNPAYEEALAYTRGIDVDTLRANYNKTSSIPLQRSGKLSEVGDLVAFLASDRAGYIHGTTINISGGKSRA